LYAAKISTLAAHNVLSITTQYYFSVEVFMSSTTPLIPDRQIALDAILKMPEQIRLAEIAEKIGILAALQEAEQQIARGELISRDEVAARSLKWISNPAA